MNVPRLKVKKPKKVTFTLRVKFLILDINLTFEW